MNKQGANGIGWTDFTYNPVTGCENDCFYCYARKIGMRFEGHFDPTFHEDRLEQPYKQKEPSKIFVCSMSDLFGQWVPVEWIKQIINVAIYNPQHTFQFLTKNPKRYREFDFPKNCWLGVTLTGKNIIQIPIFDKMFISYEPLLGEIKDIPPWIKWVIIGAMSGAGSKKHKPSWGMIDTIVARAKRNDIPVFMKNSLKDIWRRELLKEFPKESK